MSGSRRLRIVVLAGIAAMVLGCNAASFACEDDLSCRGDGQGFCEDNGACSFPDPMCPSGRRYGDLGPADIAGDCVPGSGTESGTTTAITDPTLAEDTHGETVASLDGVDPETTTTLADSETTTGLITTDPITETLSTTLATTSTATDTTDTSNSTGGEGDAYGQCLESSDCPEGAVCEGSRALPMTCTPPCRSDDDCPPPTSGSTVPSCHVEPGKMSWCVLPCGGNGIDCPRGMECSSWRPENFGEICTWF